MLLCDKICNLQKWNDWFLPAIKAFQINTMELMSVIKRFLMWSSHMTMFIPKFIILWKEKKKGFSKQHPFLTLFVLHLECIMKWNLYKYSQTQEEKTSSRVLIPPLPGTTSLRSNPCQDSSSVLIPYHPSALSGLQTFLTQIIPANGCLLQHQLADRHP